MHIIDKIREAEAAKEVFYSFEFFPPKTNAGVENLLKRIERMVTLEPLFVDVTWGAGGSTSELTLEISTAALKFLGVEVLMHLTCSGLTIEEIKDALNKARAAGIQNILALRGDPLKGSTSWEFTKGGLNYAIDLVELIRKEHGNYFCIAVAGHPEGHCSSENLDRNKELLYLKEKMDKGADFIVTQFFYSVDSFISYMSDCRNAGITCPIIPGIMPIQSYTAFKRMTSYCNTKVPESILNALEPIQDNDEAVKAYGISLGADMCHALVTAGTPGLHFYTLNLEVSVTSILTKTGYLESISLKRQYPWRASTEERRKGEDVRPINWANRPHSYIARTEVWDEFPNGRWGDGRSPAFGELSDSHFYRFAAGSREDRRAMWGESPIEESEIFHTFVLYVTGKIPKLPWCEGPLQIESSLIREKLSSINKHGFLTINSQPRANGEHSNHPYFGWGGAGGRVYQKAYVEFFTSESNFQRVLQLCSTRPHFDCFAVDSKGNFFNSKESGGTIALTWGVFPRKEILQPTIFDLDTFVIWSREAFLLWTDLWASAYLEESSSYALLHDVHDSYKLVAIIDNDYFEDDLWGSFFEDLLDDECISNNATFNRL